MIPVRSKWTTDDPTAPGWYWRRRGGKQDIVHVLNVWERGINYIATGFVGDGLPHHLNYEWAGPIQPPDSQQAVDEEYLVAPFMEGQDHEVEFRADKADNAF